MQFTMLGPTEWYDKTNRISKFTPITSIQLEC